MGYTIYWRTASGAVLAQDEAKACVAAIRGLMGECADVVQSEFTSADADSTYNINFNGIGGGAHETFTFYTAFVAPSEVPRAVADALTWPREPADHILTPEGHLAFNFCKTAAKPYDRVVKLALMKIQEVTGGKLVLSDDGENLKTDPPGWREMLNEVR